MREEQFEVADVLLKPDLKDGQGTFASLLHLVAYKLKSDHMEAIIDVQDSNVIDPVKGDSPLHQLMLVWTKDSCAAKQCLSILLKAEANINQANFDGYTPLHMAVSKQLPMVV